MKSPASPAWARDAIVEQIGKLYSESFGVYVDYRFVVDWPKFSAWVERSGFDVQRPVRTPLAPSISWQMPTH